MVLADFIKNLNKGYTSYTSQFQNNYTPTNYGISNSSEYSRLHADALNRAYMRDLESKGSRSLLDRSLDLLQAGQYVTMGAIKGMVDNESKDNITPLQGMWEGLKAANPFGQGNAKGEFSTSQVMEELGWKPESTIGKIAKGTVGFIGDVFLDPTTYLSFGLSATLKGGGKVASQASKIKLMDLSDAEKLVRDTLEARKITNVPKEQIMRDAEAVMRKNNELAGARSGGHGISLSLANAPFGEKLFGGLADKRLTFVADDSVRSFADKYGTSLLYSKTRNAIYGSKIGEMFSTKTPLYRLAQDDPTSVYDMVRYTDMVQTLGLDKFQAEKMIRSKYTEMGLTPDEAKETLRLLEDKTIWVPIKKLLKFSDTQEGARLREVAEQKKVELEESLGRVRHTRDTILKYTSKQGESRAKLMDEINDIERRMTEHATSSLSKVKEWEDLRAVFQREFDELSKAIDKPENPFDNIAKKYELYKEQNAINRSTMNDPDIWKDSRELGENPMDVVSETNLNSIIDDLNNLLFDGEKRISYYAGTHAVDTIMELVSKGMDMDEVRNYVRALHRVFSGRERRVNSYVAQKLGYRNFDERYGARARSIQERMSKGERVTEEDMTFLTRVREIQNERNLETMKLNHLDTLEEVEAYIAKEADQKMWDDLNQGNIYEDNILDDSLARRSRFTDEDMAMDVKYTPEKPLPMQPTGTKKWGGREYDVYKEEGKRTLYVDKETGKVYRLSQGKMVHVRDRLGQGGAIGDKSYKSGEFKDRELYRIDDLTISDAAKAQSEMQRQFQMFAVSEDHYKWLHGDEAGLILGADSKMTPQQRIQMQMMMDEIPNVLRRMNKNFADMSDAERAVLYASARKLARQKHPVEWSMVGKAKEATHTLNKGDASKISPENAQKRIDELKEEQSSLIRERSQLRRSGEDPKRMREIEKRVDEIDREVTNFSKVIKEGGGKKSLPEQIKEVQEVVSVRGEALKRMDELKKMIDDADIKIKNLQAYDNKVRWRYDRLMKSYEDKYNELNSASENYKEALRRNDERASKIQEDITRIEDGLADDDAFEAYMRGVFERAGKDGKVDDIIERESPVEYMLDSSRTSSEKVENMVRILRAEFQKIADEEVALGKLSAEQVDNLYWDYVTHLMSPEGAIFAKTKKGKKALGDVKDRKYVSYDSGYGSMFNPYNLPRKHKGNIEELNKKFAPYLKGKNLFSEDIADIMLARALKHNELMYDHNYMEKILHDFSNAVNPDVPIKEGYKGVMNVNKIRNFMNQLVSTRLSMELSDIVSSELREFVSKLPGNMKPTREQIKTEVERIVKTFDEKFLNDTFDKHYADVLKHVDLKSETIENFATPMVELNQNQIKGLFDAMEQTKADYGDLLVRRKTNFEVYGGDEDDLKRILKTEEIFNKLEPPDVREINDAIVGKANQIRKMQIAKDQSRFLTLYDKLTHLIKLNMTTINPAFHARNKMSNVYANWLGVGVDALNPKLNWDVMKLVRSGGKMEGSLTIRNATGASEEIPWEEVYNLAKRYNVIDEGFFTQDLGAGVPNKGMIPKAPRWADPTDSESFAPYKVGQSVGSFIENSDRITHFVSLIKRGVPHEIAAESSRKFLFNYSDLTEFEQRVMKRVIPFYTWLRKNSRLQVGELIDQPEKFRFVAKIRSGVEGMSNEEDRIDKAYVNDFAYDWIQTPFSSGGEPILWNPNLPFNDLSRLPDPFRPIESLKEIFTQSNPLFKVPIEQIINYQAFFERPIVEEGATLGQNIGARADHVASQNVLYQSGKNLIQREGTDRVLQLINSLTGVKALSYNDTAYKAMIMEEMYEDRYGTKPRSGVPRKASTIIKRFLDENVIPPMMIGDVPSSYVAPSIDEVLVYRAKADALSAERGTHVSFVQLESPRMSVGERNGLPSMSGDVLRVVDGDTIEVDIGGQKESVRLLLIDTPETVDMNSPIMPYGKEASEYMTELLSGKNVKLHFELSQRDHYNRLIAYVEVDDGLDVNKSLLDKGLAKVRYADGFESRLNSYRDAQQGAFIRDEGVWNIPGYSNFDYKGDYNVNAVPSEIMEELNRR